MSPKVTCLQQLVTMAFPKYLMHFSTYWITLMTSALNTKCEMHPGRAQCIPTHPLPNTPWPTHITHPVLWAKALKWKFKCLH